MSFIRVAMLGTIHPVHGSLTDASLTELLRTGLVELWLHVHAGTIKKELGRLTAFRW